MIRRMTKSLAAVLTAALILPAAATAQTMDFACPDPGTTFTYDSGTKVVARGRDGMDCTMEIVGGKPYKLRALLFDNPSPDGRDMSAFINALKPERLWPLEVGKKIEARYSAGGHRAVSRWWISPADKYAIRFDYSDGSGKANRAVVTSITR